METSKNKIYRVHQHLRKTTPTLLLMIPIRLSPVLEVPCHPRRKPAQKHSPKQAKQPRPHPASAKQFQSSDRTGQLCPNMSALESLLRPASSSPKKTRPTTNYSCSATKLRSESWMQLARVTLLVMVAPFCRSMNSMHRTPTDPRRITPDCLGRLSTGWQRSATSLET